MLNRHLVRSAAAAAVLFGAVPASAADHVVNGGFETLTNGPNLGSNLTAATGWAVTSPGGSYSGQGYSIFFGPGAADTTGATDNNPFNVGIWGPGNGENNGFTSSPSGGNFFASDSDPIYASKISQTLTGLTIGQTYRVKFDWAGSQLYCLVCGPGQFMGATSHSFVVDFGTQSQSTATVYIPSHGFSGWMSETFKFTALNTSEVLSFLSVGGPQGLPPMALLDGVSVTVPEPGTWALMLAGFGLTGFAMRRRVPVGAA